MKKIDDVRASNYFAAIIMGIMSVVLMIWPFGLASFLSIRQTVTGLGMGSDKLVMLCLLFGVIVICIAGYKMCSSIGKRESVFVCLILFSVSFLLRISVCVILQAEPISDFATCYDYAANGSGANEYLARFPYLGMYALTLQKWFQLTLTSVLSAQILNALVTSLISVIIFLTICQLTQKTNIAFVGAFIYAVFPDMIIYTAVPSCEHFSQFFLILTVYFFVLMKKSQSEKKQYLWCVATGFAFGLMYAYKRLFIMVAPAILMANFCYELVPEIVIWFKEKTVDYKRIAKIIIRSLLIVLVTVLSYEVITYSVQVRLAGKPITGSGDISTTIYEGLAKEGAGTWSAEVKQFVNDAKSRAGSKEELRKILFDALKEDYQNNPEALAEVLYRKFNITWGTYETYYGWIQSNAEHSLQGSQAAMLLFGFYPGAFWGGICLIVSIGLFALLFAKKDPLEKHILFILIGSVFLFTLACIFLEAQKRYSSSFIPVICVIAALGIDKTVLGVGFVWSGVEGYVSKVGGRLIHHERGKKND